MTIQRRPRRWLNCPPSMNVYLGPEVAAKVDRLTDYFGYSRSEMMRQLIIDAAHTYLGEEESP